MRVITNLILGETNYITNTFREDYFDSLCYCNWRVVCMIILSKLASYWQFVGQKLTVRTPLTGFNRIIWN